ncbi:MAG: phosphatidylserine decarboxylase family protein [Bacteroidota bacterium]
MTIHKEGFAILGFVSVVLIGINIGVYFFAPSPADTLEWTVITSLVLFFFVLCFFRSPRRDAFVQEKAVISPADGKVVAIEETVENEYIQEKCIQISIFMDIFNVHINWFPVSGVVRYLQHHSGRFHAAFLPKASSENERTTVALETDSGKTVVVHQIAGAIARRIVCYAKYGEKGRQCGQFGFIKFGSRVDLFLPLDSRIDVNVGQRVKGRQTILGWID